LATTLPASPPPRTQPPAVITDLLKTCVYLANAPDPQQAVLQTSPQHPGSSALLVNAS
jgi:hypothetical protein